MSEGIKRNGFTFYASFYHALHMEHVSDSDRLRLYDAIAEYSLFSVTPNFSDNSMLQMAWLLIEPTLSSSLQKSLNGTKAKGCPKPSMIGNKNAKKLSEDKAKTEQKQTNIDVEIDIDVENDKEYYMEGLETSERRFIHTLGIKNNLLFRIVCEFVRVGAHKGYKKQNFVDTCAKVISYTKDYNIPLDTYLEHATNNILDGGYLAGVCSKDYFKQLKKQLKL